MTTSVLCAGSFRLTSFLDRRAMQGKCPVCLRWVSASRAGMVRQHMTPEGMGDKLVTGVQTCALPILLLAWRRKGR